jgi:hypothetical protein
MADFNHSRMEDPNPSGNPGKTLSSAGTNVKLRRMLGNAGAGATGKGQWLELSNFKEKNFYLYLVDQAGGTLGSPIVTIEGAMELDPADADLNTKVETLATLNSGTLSAFVDVPWRYVRANVGTAGTTAIQVGLHAIGV